MKKASLAIITMLIFSLLNGCVAANKKNLNDLKKSPCACLKMTLKQG
ncbi:MAG: hypothetical protein GY718_06410 [Lentisphaerae bacterium]|nr:hypothetical protein [Lentisphaerota bacterium]